MAYWSRNRTNLGFGDGIVPKSGKNNVGVGKTFAVGHLRRHSFLRLQEIDQIMNPYLLKSNTCVKYIYISRKRSAGCGRIR